MNTRGRMFLLGAGVTAILFWTGQMFFASRHPESVEKQKDMSTRQLILAFEYPEQLDFAGEPVPFGDFDIHERLDKEIQVNAYWQSNTLLLLKRAHRYKSMILRILKEEGVPEDFFYLALAESGLSQVASSRGANGFWQFMPETAKQFGLVVNDNIDERMHIVKSTRAACSYLKSSYRRFNSWTLAAASYNMGNGGLASAVKSQQASTYYDLYLNQETSRYVFRILALKLIFSDPENFGFKLYNRDLYRPMDTRVITVNATIPNLAEYAIAQGTSYKMLKLLNPWLLQNKLIAENGNTFELLLPEERKVSDPVLVFPDSDFVFPKIYKDELEAPYRKPDSFK